jgi:hypothetical protein
MASKKVSYGNVNTYSGSGSNYRRVQHWVRGRERTSSGSSIPIPKTHTPDYCDSRVSNSYAVPDMDLLESIGSEYRCTTCHETKLNERTLTQMW